jgi:hypothetical protein
VSCAFSKEALALHVGGDLVDPAAAVVAAHLAGCDECRQFVEDLRATQALFEPLRRERVEAALCARMRRDVMAAIGDGRDRAGWALRLERAIWLAVRLHAYAVAALALIAIASVSLVARMQMRDGARPAFSPVAVFEGRETLIRPEGYRDWVVVSRSSGPHPSGAAYVNPVAYREYQATGAFPEGTVLVWASIDSPVLLASVKDRTRFDEGWGFFDFTEPAGAVAARADVLPESSGCRTCHRRST